MPSEGTSLNGSVGDGSAAPCFESIAALGATDRSLAITLLRSSGDGDGAGAGAGVATLCSTSGKSRRLIVGKASFGLSKGPSL